MVARDDDDAWSRDRGPRYDGGPIRVGLPPVDELEFFGDTEMRDAHLAFREQPRAACHRRRRLARAVPGRRRAAVPGSVGGRTAGRVRRLPCRATGFDPPRGARDPAQRREVHRGRRVRGAAAAAGTQGRGGAAVAARWTCWWCRPSAPRSPSTRCWPGPSTATRCSATTPTSATCSTCSVSRFRWARTADGRPYSAMLLGAALTDDTVLQLAAQILDEPREPVRRSRIRPRPASTSEEPV